VVRHLIERHRVKQHDFGYHLWLLLTFELWCRMYLDPPAPTPLTV